MNVNQQETVEHNFWNMKYAEWIFIFSLKIKYIIFQIRNFHLRSLVSSMAADFVCAYTVEMKYVIFDMKETNLVVQF